MDLCFRDGQFPCRWVPDMGYGYGYPLFNYYPPLPYYFGEIVHLLGVSFIDSTKVMFMAAFVISGITMFLLGKSLWGNWGGLLSAVLYIWAPYHSVDIYVRGAMNEAWALAFLPGVYWAVYEITVRERVRARKLAWFALMFGLLLLSHNLMAFIFTPTFGLFALLLIWLKKRSFKEKATKLVLGGVWGLGLAAFFTLPVLLEKKYVHVETMLMGYFNYLAHYVSIGKLLFTRFWGYGSSGWLQETGMPFQVGIYHWALALTVFILVVILYLKKKVSREPFALSFFFLVLFFGPLFMVHPRSVFIWDRIPLLAFLQFPWRFLTIVIFALSLLGGQAIALIKNNRLQPVLAIVLAIAAIGYNFPFFRMEKIIPMTDEEKLFSAKGWNKLQTDAIFDYLPIYAKAPPGGPAPELPEIEGGQAYLTEVKKGSDWYQFKVKIENEAKLQLPVYDFPGWKVWANNKKVDISHDNFLGLIAINLSPGDYQVKAELTNTPVRTLANTLSLVSWIIFLILLLKKPKERI